MVFACFCAAFFSFYFFFYVSDGKIQKTCLNAKTNDYDQRTECGAPVCQSKYTTTDCVFSYSGKPACNKFDNIFVVLVREGLDVWQCGFGWRLTWVDVVRNPCSFSCRLCDCSSSLLRRTSVLSSSSFRVDGT